PHVSHWRVGDLNCWRLLLYARTHRFNNLLTVSPPIIEHIIHRLAEAALLHRFIAHTQALPGIHAAVARLYLLWLADDADALEAGALEEGVDMPHGRERLDPGDGAGFAGTADEGRADARAAVGRVQHHARQQPELAIERRQRHS